MSPPAGRTRPLAPPWRHARGFRGWALALALVSALGPTAGCAAARQAQALATLPDGPIPEPGTPEEILAAGAASTNPSVRGRALAWQVRTVPADQITRWAMQGTYDPVPWVQTQVAQALLDRLGEPGVRGLAMAYATRGSGDPYVRARVVLGLLAAADEGRIAPVVPELTDLQGAWRTEPAWRAAPLALAAHRLGDTDALDGLAAALATAEVRSDAVLFTALGTHGSEALLPALERGRSWAEDALAVQYALAGARLGDRQAGAAWRRAVLSTEAGVQQDALALLLPLPGPERAERARGIQRAADPSVAEAARLMARPRPAPLAQAAGGDDAFVALVALDLATDLSGDEAERVLSAALSVDDDARRLVALEQVGTRRIEGLRGAAAGLLVDDNAAIRTVAAGVLVALTP